MDEKHFMISTDKSRLDIETIHAYLSERSYWAQGRTLEAVRTSIANSLCFGVYGRDGRLAGFARVLSDFTVFAYLMDVFILEEYRGKGLGRRLIATILNYPDLRGLKRWQLITSNAHALYRPFGFAELAAPEKHMEKVDAARR